MTAGEAVARSNCGQSLKPGNRFCTHCGAPVKEKLASIAKTVLLPVLMGTEISSDEAWRRQHQSADERGKRQREREEQSRRRREDEQSHRRVEEDRRRRRK